MTTASKCPRRAENPHTTVTEFENKPDDGTCDYCGSLMPDEFMRRLEDGDIALGATTKNYKVYVLNNGGEKFRMSYRIDEPSKPGEIMKDPMDQSHWKWETKETDRTKFYFQHLSVDQQNRFIELMNAGSLTFEMGMGFSPLPFFVGQK